MKYLRLAVISVLLATAGIAWAASRRQELLDKRRQVQLEMATTRQRLLREKDELRELHERIRSLQVVLTNKLDAEPEMAALQQKLTAIDADLKTTGE